MANKPSLADIFSGMCANETIVKAKEQKDPKKLGKSFGLKMRSAAFLLMQMSVRVFLPFRLVMPLLKK